MSEIIYPVRCVIVDPDHRVGEQAFAAAPDVSIPHLGKEGIAELVECEMFGETVEITLDDGNIIYGYECWWVVKDE